MGALEIARSSSLFFGLRTSCVAARHVVALEIAISRGLCSFIASNPTQAKLATETYEAEPKWLRKTYECLGNDSKTVIMVSLQGMCNLLLHCLFHGQKACD